MVSLFLTAALATIAAAANCSRRPASSSVTASSSIVSSTTSSASCSPPTSTVSSTTCSGKTYVYKNLAAYGFVPGDAKDKFGDTLGGIGSSAHIVESSWTLLPNGSYTGTLFALPNRGWNTQGTLNFNPRIHKFKIVFTPQPWATVSNPSQPNLWLLYQDTIKITDPSGQYATGLDGDASGSLSFPGFSTPFPVASFTGDGFGGGLGSGDVKKRIPIDAEGLVVNSDGSFWVSDEYGPYIYSLTPQGQIQGVIRPPDAVIPRRNGAGSWSANSPPVWTGATDDVTPANPVTGRYNNQGLEGLTRVGNTLYALMQSALVQEGGGMNTGRKYTRMLAYDVSNQLSPIFIGEYVVTLPQYTNANGNGRIAAQSELHGLGNGQFLVLARDNNVGRGQANSESKYRHIDVFDISTATQIGGSSYDAFTGAIASSSGTLKAGISTANYCPWLDFNVNDQLNRFGVHNGGNQDAGLLNEKWESMAVVPVNPSNPSSREYFIFSLSDNDFITQNGFMNGGAYPYSDASGASLDNQVLVFQVTIPQ